MSNDLEKQILLKTIDELKKLGVEATLKEDQDSWAAGHIMINGWSPSISVRTSGRSHSVWSRGNGQHHVVVKDWGNFSKTFKQLKNGTHSYAKIAAAIVKLKQIEEGRERARRMQVKAEECRKTNSELAVDLAAAEGVRYSSYQNDNTNRISLSGSTDPDRPITLAVNVRFTGTAAEVAEMIAHLKKEGVIS